MCTGVGEAQRVVPCRNAKDGRWQGGLGDASGNIQQACAAVCTAYGQESQLFAGDHAGQSRVDGGWLYGINPQLLLVATNGYNSSRMQLHLACLCWQPSKLTDMVLWPEVPYPSACQLLTCI